METITHKIISRTVATYIRDYHNPDHFIEYCKNCSNYATQWTCPPYDNHPINQIRNYEYIHIIGTKITLGEEKNKQITPDQQAKYSRDIITKIRKELDASLLDFEKKYSPGFITYPGNCLQCTPEQCTRIIGQPCRRPHKARPSLEACGFDMLRTASEQLGTQLKWMQNNHLPSYFMLISALFTNKQIDSDWIYRHLPRQTEQ